MSIQVIQLTTKNLSPQFFNKFSEIKFQIK